MPEKLVTRNVFQGMVRDNLHSLSDAKSYRLALNAVLSNRDEFGVFSNEESNKLCGGGDGIVGMTYLDERDETLAFKENGDVVLIGPDCGDGEFVFNASEFGCDFQFGGCEWHDIETKVEGSNCKETFVYFSSKCEYYRFNLDEMLSPKRKAGLIERLQDDTCECTRGCDYFKVFQCACAPKINAKAYESGGGGLAAGSYLFVARLINSDGGETNWFHISDPVSIGSENNIAGEPGNGHIEVQMSCLDCRYSRIELAVIERIGGVVNTKSIDTFNYNNGQFSFNYTGSSGTPIDIAEVLVKGKTYLQGKNLTQKDGRMFYYGIKPRKNLNYQYLANQISTEWVEYELPVEQACKTQVKSFMRGETYAFAIVFHFKDGTSSPAFHIPSLRGFGSSDAEGSTELLEAVVNGPSETTPDVIQVGDNTGSIPTSSGSISITDNGLIVYKRSHTGDSIQNPQNDDYDSILENLIDSYNTSVQNVCNSTSCAEDSEASQCCQCGGGASATACEGEDGCVTVSVPAGEPCPSCGAATQACENDLPVVEDMHSIWQGILADFGVDNLTITDFTPSSIKEAASAILDSVQQRERREYSSRQYSVDRPENTYAQDTQELAMVSGGEVKPGSIRSGNLYDCCGVEETEASPVQIRTWPSIPKIEKDQKYPCNKDCNGNDIYGSLAGSEVSHHTTPSACDSPPWVSHSIGVPSMVTPDVDEYSDGYVRPLGVRFSGITLPTIDETSIPLCDSNPYSIVAVKRTDKNKSILLKGYAFGTYSGSNNGKEYEVPRHGANSPETVNRYLDEGGDFPRLSTGGSGNSHVVFSLDGCTRKPALNADTLVRELEVSGEGFRHGLYAEGSSPDDEVHGNKIDQRGTRQAINLNKYTQSGCIEHPIDFKIYAPAHSVVAPPPGGSNKPLLNKAQQEAIWVGSSLEQKQDSSFVGDVLQHSVPISNAESDYVAFKRDMPNQYGSLVNLTYTPILHGGKNSVGGVIEGLGGDTFIGPYSFTRTSFVSDRVGSCAEGEKFNIPAQVPIKKERRCICDDPNDAIHSLNGQWVWTKLPEDGAAADPKNWAGTHTVVDSYTATWGPGGGVPDAGGNNDISNAPISDFYYPKTLKTLFTVWGEWEVNPWLRQRGDELNEQHYPNIKPEYSLDSTSDIGGKSGWENGYLNQFYCEVKQPSLWTIQKKAFIGTLINTIFPALGFGTTLAGVEGALDMTTTIASYPVFAAMWYFIKQVLYNNNVLDNLFGIPRCKTDDSGGEDDQCIRNWFENYCHYNWDYSCGNDFDVHYGMPEDYKTCPCDTCLVGDTEVVMSNFKFKKIKNIKVGEEVLSYDFKKEEYVNKQVLNHWNNGVKDLYRIHLNDTYIDCTLNHKWFVVNRNKRERDSDIEIITTKELIEDFNKTTSKYKLVFSSNIPTNSQEERLSPAEAYLLGMYIAEGVQRHKNKKQKPTFLITQYKNRTLEKLVYAAQASSFNFKVTQQGVYLKDLGCKGDIFLEVGSKAWNKRIPEQMFNQPKIILENLYQGLMDGDGHVTKELRIGGKTRKHPMEKYHTTSEGLNKDFRFLSRLVGKACYTAQKTKTKKGRDYYTTIYSKKSHINQGSVKGTGKLKIYKIEKLEHKAEVFDIEVEGTHSFILADSGVITHNCTDENLSNEIYWSDQIHAGDTGDAYRTVRPLNNMVVTGEHGRLTDIYSQGGGMWLHTTEGFGQLRYGRTSVPSSTGEIIVGTGDLLQQPVFYNEGMYEGWAGLKNKSHSINTQYGRFWVDEDACKVYRQNGSSVKEISNRGMTNFLKENLCHCSTTECKDNAVEGTSGYALGFDPRYNRILITKNDGDPSGSFTISYDVTRDVWISFHSYIPRRYHWDRKNLYSLGPGGMWEHNCDCSYQTFYGTYYPHILEFTAVSADLKAFNYSYTELNTEAEECSGCHYIEDIDTGFNKVAAYNSTESTGTMDVLFRGDDCGEKENQREGIEEYKNSIDFNKVCRIWRFNGLCNKVDYSDCKGKPMLIGNTCQPYCDINEDIIDCAIQEGSLTDKYLTYRLTFDKSNKINLNTISAETYGTECQG